MSMLDVEIGPGASAGPPAAAGDGGAFSAVRRFARTRAASPEEKCDLCGEAIASEHRHLLDLQQRRIYCSCRACALLLDSPAAGGGSRQLIPTRIVRLPGDAISEAQWDRLQVPVNTAFFCKSTTADRTMAFYPSPMGATESNLPMEAWSDVEAGIPLLREMAPDVEALLIHLGTEGLASYLVPIDQCYRLIGLIRRTWKGISGGQDAREQIDRFFAELNARANASKGAASA